MSRFQEYVIETMTQLPSEDLIKVKVVGRILPSGTVIIDDIFNEGDINIYNMLDKGELEVIRETVKEEQYYDRFRN